MAKPVARTQPQTSQAPKTVAPGTDVTAPPIGGDASADGGLTDDVFAQSATTAEGEGEAMDVGEAEAPPVAPRMAAPQDRVYGTSREIDHDLFKLVVARMIKNVSFTDVPDYEKVEHVHFFHTVDSSGRPQTYCGAVGGHFHKIDVIQPRDKDGAILPGVPTIRVSRALHWVREKVNGRFQRVAREIEYDSHTHRVEYRGSQRIQTRETNPNFAAMQAELEQRQRPSIPGVVES